MWYWLEYCIFCSLLFCICSHLEIGQKSWFVVSSGEGSQQLPVRKLKKCHKCWLNTNYLSRPIKKSAFTSSCNPSLRWNAYDFNAWWKLWSIPVDWVHKSMDTENQGVILRHVSTGHYYIRETFWVVNHSKLKNTLKKRTAIRTCKTKEKEKSHELHDV